MQHDECVLTPIGATTNDLVNCSDEVIFDTSAGTLDITFADNIPPVSSSTGSAQTYLDTLISRAKPYSLGPIWGKQCALALHTRSFSRPHRAISSRMSAKLCTW